MAGEMLVIPEELLLEVVTIIKTGVLISRVSTRPTVLTACDLLEEWADDMDEHVKRTLEERSFEDVMDEVLEERKEAYEKLALFDRTGHITSAVAIDSFIL